MELIERGEQLDALRHALAAAADGRGRLVLVGAEAAGGKSALVEEFCRRLGSGERLLRGACDGLITPRPLGPVHDIAAQSSGPLARCSPPARRAKRRARRPARRSASGIPTW